MARRISPYSGKETRPSVVMLLDVLGFGQMIEDTSKNKTEAGLLRRLLKALGEAKPHLSDKIAFMSPKQQKEKLWDSKLFTDNVVVGIPIFQEGEGDLGIALQTAGLYQYALAQHGFFIRGAIAVGELFMNSDVVFGSGLIRAYKFEREFARNPRVVIAPSALELIQRHLCHYGEIRSAPHDYYLLVDTDGQLFVNYLMAPLAGAKPNKTYRTEVRNHKNKVEESLALYRNNPRIWSKYAWIANYHNFVANWLLRGKKAYVVGNRCLEARPKRLREVYEKRGADLSRTDTGELIRWMSGIELAKSIKTGQASFS